MATAESQVVEEEKENRGGRTPNMRRMSVKRISQQEKDEMAKQAVMEESDLRRVSLAQQVRQLVHVWQLSGNDLAIFLFFSLWLLSRVECCCFFLLPFVVLNPIPIPLHYL